jgi:hypothetical protein
LRCQEDGRALTLKSFGQKAAATVETSKEILSYGRQYE